MRLRPLILPLLAALSMVIAVKAEAKDSGTIERCANIYLDRNAAQGIGYALRRIKLREVDIPDDGSVVVQPVMAGLKGPSVTLIGRDVRLATTVRQASPQELWQNAQWNTDQVDGCAPPKKSFKQLFLRGLYWNTLFDTEGGFTTGDPSVLVRSRVVASGMLVRPHGFIFGGSLSLPIGTNTESLLYLPDNRPPVRRDMARFTNGVALERLFASWRTTPITDVHIGFSGGWLEEMYGGAGAEIVYRPFGSAFWGAADGWKLWRHDPESELNANWSDEDLFSGHVRVGYDVPNTRTTVSLAAGQYLGGDKGATLGVLQKFEGGARIEAGVTWTDRSEDEGFFRDTHFDPKIKFTWPLNGPTSRVAARINVHQVGRDGGQMLDRPMPLEEMTESFSAREYARHWPYMFDDKPSR